MKLLIFLLVAVSTVESGFFTKKYELTLTPQFFDGTEFTGKTIIHVGVTGSVKEFDLKVSKDLNVQRVSFTQGSTISRGRPNSIVQTANIKMNEKENRLHVTLLSPVTPESIKEEGFIEINYKGKVGKKGANKGLYFLNAVDYETNLKNGNAIYLFPILEDVAAPLTLSVITPYRAGVETKLKEGKHADVKGKNLFSNNFNSGEEKVKISDLYFKISAPTDLVLDSN